ncbi:Rrf2 family transcriptional regulator [Salinicoccus sediminis]|uniref:Rrf2 family transcriptional regulator n=1 Tax=Salinicoccus sediminis TaxID=1432562 RepID=A0A0M2SR19_9STAP|nr:Rrf2 family transcriptional regulator [Salinicoccus sediminis]KKK35427.1 Rrf2 family transcriptional regulator [Salinicoccus sediminis]
MKISTRGRYGLYFMLALAEDYEVKKRSVKSVAEERGISDLYLEQIVASLKKENLVKSTRGAYGGYELNFPPDEIMVGRIFRTLEENIVAVETDEKDTETERYLWRRVRDALRDVLDHTTLADLLSHSEDEIDDYMFYI